MICNFFLFVLWRQRAERDEKEKLTEKKLIRTDHARGKLAIREETRGVQFFQMGVGSTVTTVVPTPLLKGGVGLFKTDTIK
jgi:hypothetical protein